MLRYYAALARTMTAEERRPAVGVPRGDTLVRQEPVGVVAAIVPWNAPTLLTSFKLAPALAAGCTLVLKPAPETALDPFLLAEAVLDVGLPAGVVNIVPGDARVGEYLVAHPGVDKVAFTGSTQAGRHVGEVCGRLLRPVTLELGGKSAAIVLDDADLAATAQALVGACLLNNGQWCNLSTRILAPRSRYGEVLDLVTDVASSLVVGNPLDPGVHVGPLVSARHRDRVESYIEAGRSAGAKLTTGGGRPTGLDTGWFIDPTVFGEVSNDTRIAREEIFGPVLVVIPYTDVDEAVAIANDSDYGLAGTVFTADLRRALDVARRVRTGTFGINQYQPDLGSPFGGVKASGIGRETGPEGLMPYLQPKSVYLPT
jgi:acyl-CoA reductase-like NAD-dependent aldehyde dehydrogenase